MTALRSLMEELGYTDVSTLLNSGNVVFRASRTGTEEAARQIQAALAAKLGVSARVMVLSAEELAQIVKSNPLGDVADNPSRMLVGCFGGIKPIARNWITLHARIGSLRDQCK